MTYKYFEKKNKTYGLDRSIIHFDLAIRRCQLVCRPLVWYINDYREGISRCTFLLLMNLIRKLISATVWSMM